MPVTRRDPEKNADKLREMFKPPEEVFSGSSNVDGFGRVLAHHAFFGALLQADLVRESRHTLVNQIIELEDSNAELRLKNKSLDADRREYHEDSRTDALTGLLNRTGFEEAFEAWKSSNPNSKIALIFIDLNDLKDFNDTHSHAIGDVAIMELGRAIKAVTRKRDMVARPHGDEYMVGLVEPVGDEPSRGEPLDLESYMNDLPRRIRQVLEDTLVPEGVPEGLVKDLITKLRTIKFAYGGTVCDKNDLALPIGTLLGRAEELMYINKYEQKSHQRAQLEDSIEYFI